MFMDGRPPVNVGVTSSGDVFGGTAVTFSDVLGDQQFSLFAASISQYRTLSLSYLNLAHRFNYALQGYSQTQFFYGNLEGVFYDPAFSGIIDRDLSIATERSAARRRSASGRSTGTAAWSSPAASSSIHRELQRSRPSGVFRAASDRQFGRRSSARARSFPSASTSCRKRPSSVSSDLFRKHRASRIRGRAEDWRLALASDHGHRCPLLRASRRLGATGAARPRVQELG